MKVNIKWMDKQNFEGETADGQKIIISPNQKEPNVISPPDLLLMSLGSCTGLFILPAAKALGVTLDDFEISLNGFKSDAPPKLFDKIQIQVKFKGKLTKDQAQEILEAAHEKCFILHSLNPNIKIENIIKIQE